MTLTAPPPDVGTVEELALRNLEDEAGAVEADIAAAAAAASPPESSDGGRSLRPVIALAFPTVGAALMVGGIFSGWTGRVVAVAAGLLGIAVAVVVARTRSALVSNLGLPVGIFLIGVILVAPHGPDAITSVGALASKAAASAKVLRPPAPFDAGWQVIVAWLMAVVGVVLAWTAIALKRPILGFVLSLPISAVAGISVPTGAQVPTGIVLVVLFALGIGILSGSDDISTGEPVHVAYELRRVARALPLIGLSTVVLVLIAQTDFLFPAPAYDPTNKPQKPKAVPLSQVPDRVLFTVKSEVRGPWRVGTLDHYDGKDWRLAPYDQARLKKVPDNGVLSSELTAGQKAEFTIAGLTGAILPGLPNMVAVVARGPALVHDRRVDHLRVDQGQVEAGLTYAVTAAAFPTVGDLQGTTYMVPPELAQFTSIPDAPPAVRRLLAEAPKTSKWDEFDFVRSWLLENVTVVGAGTPTSVTPERVEDMVSGSKEASPYELVAAQALAARWVGIASRMGYGFDGGDEVGDVVEVRPRHGATFVEVYFPPFGWLPVIGTPAKAQASVGSDPSTQRIDPEIVPSDDIAVQVYVPQVVPPAGPFGKLLRQVVLFAVLIGTALALAWTLYPAVVKARRRARRRKHARSAGPTARVVQAYSEWRETALDFGFGHQADTPLAFLTRFGLDEEHREFAWLVTRCLWGDLMDNVTDDDATNAEELSRALRKRLAAAQPFTLRMVATVSRLSLRSPFVTDDDYFRRGGITHGVSSAA